MIRKRRKTIPIKKKVETEKAAPIKKEIKKITMELPLLESEENCYYQRNVNITRLSYVQAQNLKRLVRGLKESDCRLKRGNILVETPIMAIRWLLENIDKK